MVDKKSIETDVDINEAFENLRATQRVYEGSQQLTNINQQIIGDLANLAEEERAAAEPKPPSQ